jgi:hypothetical protein
MFLSKRSPEFKLLEEILIPFMPNVLIDIVGSYVKERVFYTTSTSTRDEHEMRYGYLIWTEAQLQSLLVQSIYIYEVFVPDKILPSPRYIKKSNIIIAYKINELCLGERYYSKDENTYKKLNITKPSHYKTLDYIKLKKYTI